MDAVNGRIHVNFQALESQRREDDETYLQQKIQLETSIQQLQLTLQEVKCAGFVDDH